LANIGEQLRQAREEKGLSIQDIEKATHIRHAFVLALEENRFEDLPDPTYVRGFIRNYARLVGLDAEPLVETLARSTGTPDLVVPTVIAEPLWAHAGQRLRRLIIGLFLALLIAATAWLSYQYFYLQRIPWPLSQFDFAVARLATATPTVAAQPVVAPTETPLPTATPLPPTATPTETPSPTVALSPTAPTTRTPTVAQTGTPTVPGPTPADAEGLPTADDLTPTVAPVEGLPAGEGFTVKIVASDYTWLSVQVDDDEEAFVGYLDAGDERSWTGARLIALTIGNAAAASVEVNGVEVGVLGGAGQVANVRYTPETLPQ